jgi:PAS domain S-box-containing protein
VADDRGTAGERGMLEPLLSLPALAAAAAPVAAELDDSRVGRVLLEQVAGLLGASQARLALLAGDVDCWARPTETGPDAGQPAEREPCAVGLLGSLLQQGGPLHIADLSAHPLAATEPDAQALGSVLAVPLHFKDELLGAVMVARAPGEPPFTSAHQHALQVLADLAAARLGAKPEAARLRARAQELTVLDPAWRPAAEQAGDFVLITPHRDQPFIDACEAASRILGYSRETLLQRTVADLIQLPPWADKVDLLEGVREQLLAGIPITYDTTMRRRDGTLIPVRQTLQRVTAPQGFVYRATYSDLSGEKQAQLRALQAEKQRLLQEIGSGLAHELNTPLAILMGNVEMALEEFADPDLHALLEPARDAAQRISGAVQSIQRFAKPILPGAWSWVDLSQLAADVVDQTRPLWETEPQAAGRPIHLYLETFPGSPVRGNPIELQEAIRELLANAVQALPHGGRIVVHTDASEGWARLSVTDNGVGMTEEVRQRCIEPFFTTRRPLATGLGLNRVHHTVLRHRGHLDVESAEGEGSRITMCLPLAPAEGEGQAPSGETVQSPAASRG